MTKYDDQVVTRCPECGTVVQLTDVRCPRCDCFLPYGYNVKKDRQNLCYKYQKLPKWIRAGFLGVTVALFLSTFVFGSLLCLFLSLILFNLLLFLGKRTVLQAILFPILPVADLNLWVPWNIFSAKEPWDKTLLEADGTEKNPSVAG